MKIFEDLKLFHCLKNRHENALSQQSISLLEKSDKKLS